MNVELAKRWCEQQEDALQKEAKQKYSRQRTGEPRCTVAQQGTAGRLARYEWAAGQSRKTCEVRVGSNGVKEMLWRSNAEESSLRDIGEAQTKRQHEERLSVSKVMGTTMEKQKAPPWWTLEKTQEACRRSQDMSWRNA